MAFYTNKIGKNANLTMPSVGEMFYGKLQWKVAMESFTKTSGGSVNYINTMKTVWQLSYEVDNVQTLLLSSSTSRYMP